jgi:Leucine-rich repeat (LRR) protein
MEIAMERIANMRNGLNLYDLGLTELPQLGSEDPSTNVELDRWNNQIAKLHQLGSEETPPTLKYLFCGHNPLTELPPPPPAIKSAYKV